jgi:hypothetical protein
VVFEVRHQRLEFLKEFLAARHRESAHHAHVGQASVVGIETQEQGADPVRAARVHTVAGEDTVGGALVLDLEHHAFVLLVAAVQGLGHDAVESRTFELPEPLPGCCPVPGRGGQVDGGGAVGEHLLKDAAPLQERPSSEVLVVQSQQVKCHKARRRPCGQQLHPAGRRVDALLKCVEIEPVSVGPHQDDLAVEHAAGRQVCLQCFHQFREVPGHGLTVAAADLHFVAVPKDDGPESVPFRFEAHRTVGQGADKFGQHGRDRGHHRQLHTAHSCPAAPFRATPTTP